MTQQQRPIRVAALNDYPIVVSGLRDMLRPFADRVQVVELEVGATDTGDGVDIALYDTFGRARSALAHIERIVAHASTAKGVLFTWTEDANFVDAALKAGAAGVLSKALDAEQLVAGLERIHAGETVVALTETQADEEPRTGHGNWPGASHGLTQREAEMLAMITAGHTNAEIAQTAYLSPNSVKSYIRSAYRKIGVVRRSQAVAWGIEHGMTLPKR